jgi:hypothetical protein
LFIIKVTITNICVNRMARGGEYRKVAGGGGKCNSLRGMWRRVLYGTSSYWLLYR